jgi:hypothetical protein
VLLAAHIDENGIPFLSPVAEKESELLGQEISQGVKKTANDWTRSRPGQGKRTPRLLVRIQQHDTYILGLKNVSPDVREGPKKGK